MARPWVAVVVVLGCGTRSAPHNGGDASPSPMDGAIDAVADAAADAPADAALAEQVLDVIGGITVDFDAANELVVGSSSTLVFTATLAPKWTAPFNGPARFAANGDVLVRTATSLIKLAAADGHVLWQHATPGYEAIKYGTAHQMAATPAGGAVLNHGDSVEVWAPDGASTFTLVPHYPGPSSVATAADGTIYVGVDQPTRASYTYVEAFDAQGTHLFPDYPDRAFGITNKPGVNSISGGTANLVMAAKCELGDCVGFVQFDRADHSILNYVRHDYIEASQANPPPHGIATNASDEIAFFYHPAGMFQSGYGLGVVKYTSTCQELWHVERIPPDPSSEGFQYADIAIAPDGRVAAGGFLTVEVFGP